MNEAETRAELIAAALAAAPPCSFCSGRSSAVCASRFLTGKTGSWGFLAFPRRHSACPPQEGATRGISLPSWGPARSLSRFGKELLAAE